PRGDQVAGRGNNYPDTGGGTRKNVRVPPGKNLAHRRGFEAKKGYGYEHSDLQDIDLHKLQHKHEGY
ncbi:MAG: polymorphic toxin type 8 domain-containing protein, partial [Desulfococcaceae bacterium]